MKIETTPQENHQTKIIAEFEADVFESYKRRAARKIASKIKIAGFRPGKAPYDIIVRNVGEGAISEEALEMLIDAEYENVLKEANIEPAGSGSLEEVISLDPPKLSFLVPLKPEIDLGDYQSVRVDYAPPTVTDEEIREFLLRMQRNYSTAEPAERPIEMGDLVYFKLSAVKVDDDQLFADRPQQVIVGDSMTSKESPYEGFSLELIGLSEGEEKTVEHQFEEVAEETEFSGSNVRFTVNIQSVKSLVLPELNDEFAVSLGHFENFEELQQGVKEQLLHDKTQEYEDDYISNVLAKIKEQATLKYPPMMVDEEIEHLIASVEHDLKHQNLDFATYLKLLNTDREQYVEEHIRPAAIKRVENALMIDQLGKQENVQISREDMASIIQDSAEQLQASQESKGKKTKLTNEQVTAHSINSMNRLYNQRSLERLKNIASGQAAIENGEKVEDTDNNETLSVVEETTETLQTVEPVVKKKRVTKKKSEDGEETPVKTTKRKSKNESTEQS